MIKRILFVSNLGGFAGDNTNSIFYVIRMQLINIG